MQRPLWRFRVRTLIVAVAALAMLSTITKTTIHVIFNLPFMPHISRLSRGQEVVTCNDVFVDGGTIVAGSPCIVVTEPAWDDDSCYPTPYIEV